VFNRIADGYKGTFLFPLYKIGTIAKCYGFLLVM